MKVLKLDHPDIKEDKGGIIYYKRRSKVSKSRFDSYFSVKPSSFRKILFVAEVLSKTRVPRLLSRIERPALAYIIRKDVFNDQISPRTARDYANLLILLGNRFRDLL
jgi:hypothetical protein